MRFILFGALIVVVLYGLWQKKYYEQPTSKQFINKYADLL